MDIKLSGGHLHALVERVERLEEEKSEIAGQIKEVYAEAKAHGFDPTILRAIVALRKEDPEKRAEREAMLGIYAKALGINTPAPLFDHAGIELVPSQGESEQK
ncbi:MAG: DUF2312 domain-containing protein [Pseudomonadota bacterium]